jgi:uncharacterized protein YfbU (UPF0304 family)
MDYKSEFVCDVGNNVQCETAVKTVEDWYEKYKKTDEGTRGTDDYSFLMWDLFEFGHHQEDCDIKIIQEIVNLRVTEPSLRGNKIGTKVLKSLIASCPDVLWCTSAFISKDEYSEEPSDEEKDTHIDRVSRFLTLNDFVDINFLVGYEYKRPHLYVGNEIGKKVYAALQEWLNSRLIRREDIAMMDNEEFIEELQQKAFDALRDDIPQSVLDGMKDALMTPELAEALKEYTEGLSDIRIKYKTARDRMYREFIKFIVKHDIKIPTFEELQASDQSKYFLLSEAERLELAMHGDAYIDVEILRLRYDEWVNRLTKDIAAVQTLGFLPEELNDPYRGEIHYHGLVSEENDEGGEEL